MRTVPGVAVLLFLFVSFCFCEIPVTTYSIVARDPGTGEMGVAVQSHYFSVGPTVMWAEAGVGVVATQSLVEVSYGPLGLGLMREGKSAPDALQALLAVDKGRDGRQVAMIDVNGNVAAHTGKKSIAAAGHHMGDNYSVQANLMAKDTVWPAMARAYENTKGTLAERMLAALDAAEAEGGDIRGRQSVAIVVVSGKKTGDFWKDRILDLRVEDHPEPLQELRRLMTIRKALQHAIQADAFLEKKDVDSAAGEYEKVMKLAPDYVELSFWHALGLYKAGQEKSALDLFQKVVRREPLWLEVLDRLPASELLDADAVTKIKAAAQP
jgi:uncharacterized Ntn-hydrolase superfamily protein